MRALFGLLVVAAAGVWAGGAMAAPSAGWVSRPTQAEAAAVRPAGDALARAILRCHVEDDGALSGCSVAAESPPGRGVGAAAMMLAPKYSQAPPGRSGARDIKLSIVWSNIDKGADWLRKPTAQDLLTVYPKTAHGRAGLAVIDCIVTVQGGLSDCVVESEKPEGAGFGEAAIRLSAQFLMRPATLKGAPAPSEARIPITWEAFSESSWTPGRSVAPANLPWAEAPTIAEVAAAYPAKARAEEKVGRVTLSCDMDENGRLAHCESVNAQPSGYGFEAAAKTLAKRFRYTVASDADRKAAHGVAVMMPFTFDPAARDPASAVLGKPTWAAIPSSAQLTAAFAPLKLTATGRATLSCVVQPGGSLSDCSVLSEQPTGIGVGAAALSLTPTFRVSTWSTEGLPVVGGRISIPLRYEPAPAEPAAEK